MYGDVTVSEMEQRCQQTYKKTEVELGAEVEGQGREDIETKNIIIN